MRKAVNYRTQNHLARVSSCLFVVTLIAGMTACAVPATPTVPQYELTVSSTAGGSVTAPGEGPFVVDKGTVVRLVAEAASGYQFVNWTGETDTIAEVSAASTTITMNGDYSITASFQEIPGVRHSLTMSSTVGGSITAPGEGTFVYDADTVVSMVAEAGDGYRFVTWTGDVATVSNATASITTVTMNGDYALTAVFSEDEERELVTFVDPSLEAAVREAIDKPDGPIYARDMEALASLSAEGLSIYDLTGLEYAVGLHSLNLSHNEVRDVSDLAALTDLTELRLDANDIGDVAALSSLTRLVKLSLNGNRISDISPLVQNEGFGPGDVIHLQANPLSWKSIHIYIAELRSRGVTIVYDEQGIPGQVTIVPNCEGMVAEYTITFDITADLHAGVHSITILFPEGTTVPQIGWQTGSITVNGHDVFGLEVTVVGTKVTFLVAQYVASGAVTVVFKEDAGIVNPPAGSYYLYVNTSRAPDSTPRRLGPY
jgi:uncharacterized repeat protein (TIGR02543 family)